MNSRPHYFSDPETCSYLPEQICRMEYEVADDLTTEEYTGRILRGWRRFGVSLFRPQCLACRGCLSLRVDVARFQPTRSQQRNRKKNQRQIELERGKPRLTPEKLELFDRFHHFQAGHRGWAEHQSNDVWSYTGSFLANPIPTEEWTYRLNGQLVGLGFVDILPFEGLSAIYFVHDPNHRDLGLGVWNVLSLIEECRAQRLPHLYLGYYVRGCQSLEYKGNFVPSQILGPEGSWVDFPG